MKTKKIWLIGIIFAILAVGLQANPILAQEGTPTTFGVETKSFDDQVMDFAEDANTYWLRYNGLLWSDIQATEGGPLDWSSVAELEVDLADASARGMEIILIVRGTPSWARAWDYLCSPMTVDYFDEFAAFMEEVVARYSVSPYNIKYYELWNEPDEYREAIGYENRNDPDYNVYGCWGNPSNEFFGGGHYANMLKQAYPAIKAKAIELGVEANVVIGGLLLPCDQTASSELPPWPSGVTYDYFKMSRFFEGILDNGGGPYFDFVNFHGYTSYDTNYTTGILMERYEYWWQSSGGQVMGKLNYLTGLMSKYGISGKPILMTEAALANDSTSEAVFEARKADYLVWVFVRNIKAEIAGTTWYHIDNDGWRHSGLLDRNDQPLPAYTAYQVMTTTLEGAEYNQMVAGLPTGVLGFKFLKGSNPIWVLFSENGAQKTVNKPAWFGHTYNLLRQPVVSQTETTITFDRPIYIDNLPNNSPEFTSVPITTANEDSLYSYLITINDPDFGDAHNLSATNLPTWLEIINNGDGTWTLRGTPDNALVGPYSIELVVTDSGGLTDTQSFTLTVNNVNDAPYFTSTPDTKAVMNEPYTYNIATDDPDLEHGSETLTIIAISKPVWLLITQNGATTAELSGTPTIAHVGDHNVTLRVTDSTGAYATQSFTITVSEQSDFNIYLPLVVK